MVHAHILWQKCRPCILAVWLHAAPSLSLSGYAFFAKQRIHVHTRFTSACTYTFIINVIIISLQRVALESLSKSHSAYLSEYPECFSRPALEAATPAQARSKSPKMALKEDAVVFWALLSTFVCANRKHVDGVACTTCMVDVCICAWFDAECVGCSCVSQLDFRKTSPAC